MWGDALTSPGTIPGADYLEINIKHFPCKQQVTRIGLYLTQ